MFLTVDRRFNQISVCIARSTLLSLLVGNLLASLSSHLHCCTNLEEVEVEETDLMAAWLSIQIAVFIPRGQDVVRILNVYLNASTSAWKME